MVIFLGVILKQETQNKFYITINYTLKKELFFMSKYDIEFKKSIVVLYQNDKSKAELRREYGVYLSAIAKWIKQFS